MCWCQDSARLCAHLQLLLMFVPSVEFLKERPLVWFCGIAWGAVAAGLAAPGCHCAGMLLIEQHGDSCQVWSHWSYSDAAEALEEGWLCRSMFSRIQLWFVPADSFCHAPLLGSKEAIAMWPCCRATGQEKVASSEPSSCFNCSQWRWIVDARNDTPRITFYFASRFID